MGEGIEFIGVVKKVESKSLVSLDKSYRILIETENGQLMDIGKWGGDELVQVNIQRIPKNNIGL